MEIRSPQRQFQRVTHKVPAVVQLTHAGGRSSLFGGEVQNMSVSGLCVILDECSFAPLGPGAKAKVLIEKHGSGNPIVATGSVVRCLTTPLGRHEVAVRFDRVRYDVIAAASKHERVVVELSPFGWTDYRAVLKGA